MSLEVEADAPSEGEEPKVITLSFTDGLRSLNLQTVPVTNFALTGDDENKTLTPFSVTLARPQLRGNCNGEGAVDLSDAIFLLNFLFAGGDAPEPPFADCSV